MMLYTIWSLLKQLDFFNNVRNLHINIRTYFSDKEGCSPKKTIKMSICTD